MSRTARQIFGQPNTFVQSYTGPARELVVNTDTHRVHIQDGSTAGGWPLQLLYDPDGPIINVHAYGAKGDGVTDDTVAIRSAIAAAYNSTSTVGYGIRIGFPTGSYVVTDTIVVNKNITLYGMGEASFVGAVGAGKPVFALGDSSYLTGYSLGYLRIRFERLTFNTTGQAYSILSNGVRTVQIEGCTFEGGTTGAQVGLQGAWSNSYVRNNRFENGAGTGLQIMAFCNALNVQGNRFAFFANAGHTARCLSITASSAVWIRDNDFEYSDGHILVFGNATNPTDNIHINHNWIEGALYDSITLDNTAGPLNVITIRENSAYSTTDGGIYVGKAGATNYITGIDISDNYLSGVQSVVVQSDNLYHNGLVMRGNRPIALNGPTSFQYVKPGAGSPQSVPITTPTKLSFPVKVFDRPVTMVSGSAWYPRQGLNQLRAALAITAGLVASYPYSVYIYKNGSPFRQKTFQATSTQYLTLDITCMDNTTLGDYYEVYMVNGGTGAVTVSGDPQLTWFEGNAI